MAEYTAETIAAAREWLMDCEWGDVTEDEIAAMPAVRIMRAVARHYDGGARGFAADSA